MEIGSRCSRCARRLTVQSAGDVCRSVRICDGHGERELLEIVERLRTSVGDGADLTLC